MKRFLSHRSKRWAYDGWALRVIGAPSPLHWTTCTTRKEIRELKLELEKSGDGDLFQKLEIVKVKINVEAAA